MRHDRTRARIIASAIIHATEDASRFRAAFKLLGLDPREQKLVGHFDNPITVMSATASGAAARGIISRVAEAGITADGRVDRDGLHIRLDKQELVRGVIAPDDSGSAKIRIQAESYQGDARAAYVDLLRRE